MTRAHVPYVPLLMCMWCAAAAHVAFANDEAEAEAAADAPAEVEADTGAAEADPLAVAVHGVFIQHCAACHDEAQGDVKGDFGFIMDFARLRADEFMVVPGDPDGSDVYYLVDAGEMPPKRSKQAPLPDAKKKTIHDWIAAGAPVLPDGWEPQVEDPVAGASAADTPPVTVVDSGPQAVDAAEPFGDRLYRFAGHTHLLLLHFPVALFYVALLFEVISLIRRADRYHFAGRACVVLALIATPLTAVTGWMLGEVNGYTSMDFGDVAGRHRWLGIAAAVWIVVTFALSCRLQGESPAVRRRLYLAALVVGAIVITLAAHNGGSLTHGPDFLAF